ncbi:hypothetical protein NL533_36315, partial [Klebsiella pneumoniae]|nr:hypothetical protein [Klebsiella pneumoniae]
GTEVWRESIIWPAPYAVAPPYTELAELAREIRLDKGGKPDRRRQEALRRAVDTVAGLTAVDGAMVITDQCDLLAFG